MMTFIRSLILLLLSLPLVSVASQLDQRDPYVLINQVASVTFARLKAEQQQIEQQPDHLRVVVAEELLPYINARYAAYKVLGPHLKKTTKDQRNAFVDAFTEYMVTAYAQVLTQYTDQEVEIEPAKSVPAGRKIVSVRVDIVDTQRPPIRLDFKLRQNSKTREWQAYDMVAEGISMISTKQSEWSGQLRKDGVETVTDSLRDLAARPIRREESTNE